MMEVITLYVVRILCLVALVTATVPLRRLLDLPRQVSITRPNIVLILTDDQDLLLGTINYMPHLAANVASQGVTFSQFAVPTSLCTPSRAQLLTGRFAHNNGIVQNVPPIGGFEKMYQCGFEDTTIATALQEAGYRTALVGKYANGYPLAGDPTYIAPGWDEWYVPTRDAYGYYNYQLNENGTLVDYVYTPSHYLTDVLAGKALDFVTRSITTARNTPFFAVVSMYAPHEPAVPAPRHYSWFPDEQAPRTPNFNEEDMSDKPVQMQNFPLLTESEIQSIDNLYRKRLRSLQSVDEMIAQLTQVLEDHGALENTYIIFASDNGFIQGQHRFISGKGSPYEENFRVPLIVRGPGVTAGVVRDELTEMIDLAPTLADIAGATLAFPADGRSLVPLLHGEDPLPPWRKAQLMEHWSVPALQWAPSSTQESGLAVAGAHDLCANTATPKWIGVRTAQFKFVDQAPGIRDELYDLVNDPYELQNLIDAADPAYLAQLRSWAAAYYSCAGSTCETVAAMTPPPMVLGCYDPDGNGWVDIADIQRATARWNARVGDPDYDPLYDPSGDGLISTLDFTLIGRGWGQPCPP